MTVPPRRLPDLSGLREAVDHAGSRRPAVSAWSVGQHVGHCALAVRGIAKALLRSRPPMPSRRRGWAWRQVILRTGWIPRGRARAPEGVVPPEELEEEALQALLDECAELLGAVSHLGDDAWFEHFALGVMDRDAALRFLEVHDAHHLKIVADILRG